ncbi:MAG: relaxase/mobilization nuclease domain-containing protein [Oscillospiraceae bacterium]|nr:relaxase/mobilization nuclease domain-containing protein [Oscillospiraceae bacterium]
MLKEKEKRTEKITFRCTPSERKHIEDNTQLAKYSHCGEYIRRQVLDGQVVQLNDEFLSSKYKYVLTTHVDKEHIHNHLIFCNVSNKDKKSFEYTRNKGKRAWVEIREISDKICAEFGKSVVIPRKNLQSKSADEVGKTVTKNYAMYKGMPSKISFRQKLMAEIDRAILESSSFEEFLEKMRERGVECTYNPEHKITLKFRMPEAKKNIRTGGLGYDYDEKGICRRIADVVLFRTGKSAEITKQSHKSSLIDTTTERMQNSPRLSQWAEIRNMQLVSEHINLLSQKRNVATIDGEELAEKLGELNQEIDVVSGAIYNLKTVKRYKPLVDELRELQTNPHTKSEATEFEKAYKKELTVWGKADYALRNVDSEICKKDGRFLSVVGLKERLVQLKSDKSILSSQYKSLKKELLEIDTARRDIQAYLSQHSEWTVNNQQSARASVRDVRVTYERDDVEERS